MTVRFPIYGSNFKGAVWVPPPQQPELIAPNKPSGKGLIQRRTRRQPAFRMALAFRLALMLTRCACSSGAHVSPIAHAHLAPILNRYSVSTGANAHPVPMFAWCPVSTGTPFRLAPTPTRCPCLPASLVSPGAHTRSSLMLGLMSMLAWRSCFARCPCLPGAHVRLMSTFRPTFMLTFG